MHPGFKVLDSQQKRVFRKLKAQKEDEPLSPNQQQDYDKLAMLIVPSVFGLDLASLLKDLEKKRQLNPDEDEQKARLIELKNTLPNEEEDKEEGLSAEERMLLVRFLAQRLFN